MGGGDAVKGLTRPRSSVVHGREDHAIGYWLARLVAAIERKRPVDPDKAGLVTEAQIKVFDYLFFLGNPFVKALNWLTGVRKAKNRWVLVKKLG